MTAALKEVTPPDLAAAELKQAVYDALGELTCMVPCGRAVLLQHLSSSPLLADLLPTNPDESDEMLSDAIHALETQGRVEVVTSVAVLRLDTDVAR